MHDPIRIITLPAGSKAGAISGVAWSDTKEDNIVSSPLTTGLDVIFETFPACTVCITL